MIYCGRWLTTIMLIVSFVFAARDMFAYATYNGMTIGTSNRTIYAWGVTDVTTYSFIHTAYVSARLRSPDGRSVYSGSSARNYRRVDVSLPWSNSDLGDYSLETRHTGTCNIMGTFINNLGLFLIARAGLSFACYFAPQPSARGPGYYDYVKTADCDVPCAPWVLAIYVGTGPPPSIELMTFAYLKLGGTLLCSNAAIGGDVPQCTCSFVEV